VNLNSVIKFINPSHWVDTDIITAYLRVLLHFLRDKGAPKAARRVAFIDAATFSRFTLMEKDDTIVPITSNWLYDGFKSSMVTEVVFVIHEGAHYIVAHAYLQHKNVVFYDSMLWTMEDVRAKVVSVAAYIKPMMHVMSIFGVDVGTTSTWSYMLARPAHIKRGAVNNRLVSLKFVAPQQSDGANCGVFAMFVAESLLRGWGTSCMVGADARCLRQLVIYQLWHIHMFGEMYRFPKQAYTAAANTSKQV